MKPAKPFDQFPANIRSISQIDGSPRILWHWFLVSFAALVLANSSAGQTNPSGRPPTTTATPSAQAPPAKDEILTPLTPIVFPPLPANLPTDSAGPFALPETQAPTTQTPQAILPNPGPTAGSEHGPWVPLAGRAGTIVGKPAATMPQYELDIELQPLQKRVKVRQLVTWTHPGGPATQEMVLHVYPQHRPNEKQLEVYERTLEMLRLDPQSGFDRHGGRFHPKQIAVVEPTLLPNPPILPNSILLPNPAPTVPVPANTDSGNPVNEVANKAATVWQQPPTKLRPLSFTFDVDPDTILRVRLPYSVAAGATVQLLLDYELDIPPTQGRFGQFQGVTSLVNWYPILAVYGANGWEAPPYIAWHQPWYFEAAHYRVRLQVPIGEQVATGGHILQQTADPVTGKQIYLIEGAGLRDLAIVTSSRFDVLEAQCCGTTIRVLAFPEHRFYAQFALETACKAFQMFSQWFGPYPHRTFTIAESFFGWNGNESSGLILLDERVLRAPKLGHVYIESLVSHETCHQWWYSTVGTNGYLESWVDEGLVSYLNRIYLQTQHGDDPKLLDWPQQWHWAPQITHETLTHYGYYLYHGRGGQGTALQSLTDIGHLPNLFFLIYDRGGRIFRMIHHRLGNERFFAFLQLLYQKYSFRILRFADFQQELEAFTGCSWQNFFDAWLRTPSTSDWAIETVDIEPIATGYRTQVVVRQHAEIVEPVELVCRTEHAGPPLGPILLGTEPHPGWGSTMDPATWQSPLHQATPLQNVQVQARADQSWIITYESAERPVEMEIDPQRWVLDSSLQNNSWKVPPPIRLTPIFTPLDEIVLVHPLDRQSIAFGPSIDELGRPGIRGVFLRGNRYRFSPFLIYTFDEEQVSAGLDAEIFNIPWPNWSIGVEYERALTSNLYDNPDNQGRLFLRWTPLYTTSYFYPNLGFVEGYFRFGDNFFPNEDVRPPTTPGVEDYRDIRAVGLTLHLDSRLPYWNPRSGFAVDANVEQGFRLFGDGESYQRIFGQIAVVQQFPCDTGPLAETRLVGRLAGGIGSPDNGEHFQFGGPMRFRGQRSEDTEGSAFWLASVDWRFPLWQEINYGVADNVLTLRSLYGALIYDVGESYLFGRSQGVDHAVGVGIYSNLDLLSFVESLALRLEYSCSLRRDTDVAWFGLYYAF